MELSGFECRRGFINSSKVKGFSLVFWGWDEIRGDLLLVGTEEKELEL